MKSTVLVNNGKYYFVTSIDENGEYNVVEIKNVIFKYFQHNEILERLFIMILVKIMFMIFNIPLVMVNFMFFTIVLILRDGFSNYINYNYIDVTNNPNITYKTNE